MSRAALRLAVPFGVSSGANGPLARHRVVVIGTPETVAQARDLLGLAACGGAPLGCILVDRRGTPRTGEAPGATAGLPVLGTLDDLANATQRQRLTLAVVCLPMAMADTINEVRSALRRTGLEERFIPPMQDLLTQTPPFSIGLGTPATFGSGASGRLDLSQLIGREDHAIDATSVGKMLAGKRVLITGAGGSIGSEIARIVASYGPSQVQLLERAENPLFEIDHQIARRFPNLSRRAIMHDVVDAEGTLRLLVDLRPQVVFHAAAHKHVPLMEDHPAHAVNNNLFGTKSIADAALAVGCERFVMVSSDKAVNPTSVMGATKRLAELYVQWLDEASSRVTSGATRFSMVRFGNVLGSACSVLTIWSAQLAEGGPITVTDPRMTRYFMTIPEAAALVIQSAAIGGEEHGRDAGAAGNRAAVYVLDMGEPVSILELAKRFVRGHGFEPRVVEEGRVLERSAEASGRPEIDVLITGVRPGEKLHEELSYGAEVLAETPYPGIRAWTGAGTVGTKCAAMIADLSGVRASRERDAVLSAIKRHVPEMR
jgi:FlaA1/EpsC-like NDP-sugar epimerase